MGLLFEMYSDPLNFLDVSIELIGLKDTVKKIYHDVNEKKLWELFLSCKPKMNFNEFKAQNGGNSVTYANTQVGTRNKKETDMIVKKAEETLKNFRPILKEVKK